jgi:hypothetical protein
VGNSSLKILALAASALLFFGCTTADEARKTEEILHQNTELSQDKKDLENKIQAKDAALLTLQQQLGEKNAEINALKTVQKHLSNEVVRSKTKILAPKNKAEAISLLAEIETDIAAVKEQATAGNRQALEEADQLMAQARTERDQGNYTEACALAGKALETIQPLQLKRLGLTGERSGPLPHFPLSMLVVKKSRVRKYPAQGAETVAVLEPETAVTATGRKGGWIRITVGDRQGWIYRTMLAETGK